MSLPHGGALGWGMQEANRLRAIGGGDIDGLWLLYSSYKLTWVHCKNEDHLQLRTRSEQPVIKMRVLLIMAW